MKTRTTVAVTWVAVLAFASLAMAQQPPKPTEQHKILANDVGVWDANMTCWIAGPDADPMKTKGTETNRLIGDGMWMVSDFEGEFSGMKFEGHGQFGYDPIKKKYVGTWVDTMSPHLSLMEGTYDEATKTLTMNSESVNPQTGKVMRGKNVSKRIDDNTRLFTMSMIGPDDKEIKMMEIEYKRRK